MSFPGSNTTKAARVINFKGIKYNLINECKYVMEQALEHCTDYAKDFAPVRDVFAGGRGKSAGLSRRFRVSDTGKMYRASARAEHPLLAADFKHFQETGRKRIRKGAQEQEEFLAAVKAQRAPRHRYQMLTVDIHGGFGERRETANARDFDPVVIDPTGEPRMGETKTLRDITGARVNREGKLFLPVVGLRGRRELLEPATGTRSRPSPIIEATAGDFLSSKGMAELRRHQNILVRRMNPREKNSAIHKSATGEITIGGRLRDEIYHTRPHNSGKSISGWVVSPTPYAKYQEWGTTRHRAQPYMRPALYKMRQELPRLLSNRLERPFR